MVFSLIRHANTTNKNAPIAKDGYEPIATAHQASTNALIVTAFIVLMKQRKFEYGNWIQCNRNEREPLLCTASTCF